MVAISTSTSIRNSWDSTATTSTAIYPNVTYTTSLYDCGTASGTDFNATDKTCFFETHETQIHPIPEEEKERLPSYIKTLSLAFPNKFKQSKKPLFKRNTFTAPKRKQFTSFFAQTIKRCGDFSRN